MIFFDSVAGTVFISYEGRHPTSDSCHLSAVVFFNFFIDKMSDWLPRRSDSSPIRQTKERRFGSDDGWFHLEKFWEVMIYVQNLWMNELKTPFWRMTFHDPSTWWTLHFTYRLFYRRQHHHHHHSFTASLQFSPRRIWAPTLHIYLSIWSPTLHICLSVVGKDKTNTNIIHPPPWSDDDVWNMKVIAWKLLTSHFQWSTCWSSRF